MIDFHSHLDLYPNSLEILPIVAQKNSFTLVVTTSPRAWRATSKVFAGYDNIKVALGLHPEIIEKKATERDLLISSIADTKFIGEVGLDGSETFTKTFSLQISILADIFSECQKQGGRIISLHSRNAVSSVLNLIEKYPNAGVPVLHWFTGSASELKRAISMGCWFSIGPAMLKSSRSQELIQTIPPDIVLPETDGPFATLNGEMIYPWQTDTVINFLDKIWKSQNIGACECVKRNLDSLLAKI